MKRSKWFLILAILFVIGLAFAMYDFSRRTTFPGSKKPNEKVIPKASGTIDSVIQPPKKRD